MIFRQNALERLRSPERIDQALSVVHRRDWIPLAIVAALLGLATLWGVFGRIPETVMGAGVFLEGPSDLSPIQAPVNGRIVTWRVDLGDTVTPGQVLATFDVDDLDEQLALTRSQLADVETRGARFDTLDREDAARELSLLEARRPVLDARIDATTREIERARASAAQLRANQHQRLQLVGANLDLRERQLRDLVGLHREQLEQLVALEAESLMTLGDTLLTRAQLLQVQHDLLDLQERRAQAALEALQADDTFQRTESQTDQRAADLVDLHVERDRLAARAQTLQADLERSQRAQAEEEAALRRRIDALQGERDRRVVRCDVAGRLVERAVAAGAVALAGQRLGAIDATSPDTHQRTALVYFALGDGAQLAPEMKARLTPRTVQRERFGGIWGEVTAVREWPVSAESAAHAVGNPSLARELTAGGKLIEVEIRLELDPDTPSGLRWTSGAGPDQPLDAGVVADAWVTVERRRPISYVIPLLREWTGL